MKKMSYVLGVVTQALEHMVWGMVTCHQFSDTIEGTVIRSVTQSIMQQASSQ